MFVFSDWMNDESNFKEIYYIRLVMLCMWTVSMWKENGKLPTCFMSHFVGTFHDTLNTYNKSHVHHVLGTSNNHFTENTTEEDIFKIYYCNIRLVMFCMWTVSMWKENGKLPTCFMSHFVGTFHDTLNAYNKSCTSCTWDIEQSFYRKYHGRGYFQDLLL